MTCDPAARDDVVNVARSPDEESLRSAVPRSTEPSSKVTVPVGVPAPVPVTAAVNVTEFPGAAGLADEESVVLLLPPMPPDPPPPLDVKVYSSAGVGEELPIPLASRMMSTVPGNSEGENAVM